MEANVLSQLGHPPTVAWKTLKKLMKASTASQSAPMRTPSFSEATTMLFVDSLGTLLKLEEEGSETVAGDQERTQQLSTLTVSLQEATTCMVYGT